MTREGVCVLCQSKGALSKEHALPDWTHLLFEIQTYWRADDSGESGIKRPIADVCEQCNGDMNTMVENLAIDSLKPMFRGEALSLSHRRQAHVLRWLVKTCLMIEAASDSRRFLPQTRELWAHRFDLPGSVVWIAQMEVAQPHGEVEATQTLVAPEVSASDPDAYFPRAGAHAGAFLGAIQLGVLCAAVARVPEPGFQSSVTGRLDEAMLRIPGRHVAWPGVWRLTEVEWRQTKRTLFEGPSRYSAHK